MPRLDLGLVFVSDSSSVGLFSYLVQGKECIAQRAFTEQERAESSTYRELLAFVETWTNRQVLARFRGFTVAHYTDNKGLASIICKGSSNPKSELQPLIIQAI